jgi:hypothetical protein
MPETRLAFGLDEIQAIEMTCPKCHRGVTVLMKDITGDEVHFYECPWCQGKDNLGEQDRDSLSKFTKALRAVSPKLQVKLVIPAPR